MNINRNRSFPYPVLGYRKGLDSKASATLSPSTDAENYYWNIAIEHDNDDIDELVKEGKAKYVCEVDCLSTYYRNTFSPDPSGDPRVIVVKVPKTEVGGRVNLVVTALAVSPIVSYHNSKSRGIYTQYSFDVEVGDILAIFDEWDINLDIEAKNYKRITSLIQLSLSDNDEIEIDLNDSKHIVIEIPRSTFGDHMDKLKNPFFKPALLSSLVFEALVKAFQHFSEHTEKTWARVLELKTTTDYGYQNLAESLNDDPDLAFELTRKVLEDPYAKLYGLLDAIPSE